MSEHDDLDLRLQEYGARWRAAMPEPHPIAKPVVVQGRRAPGRRRDHRWVVAASIVAVTLGGTIWATDLLNGDPTPPTPADSGTTLVPWIALDPTQPRFDTATGEQFAAVQVAGNLDLTARPGQEIVTFNVTLTSPDDLRLDPCPDFTITERFSKDDEVHAAYGLNCADVPFRDANGIRYLPAGTPVAFAMELSAPAVDVPELLWRLEVPGSPGPLTGRVVVGDTAVSVEGSGYCAVLEFEGRPYEIAPEQPGTGVGREVGTATGLNCGDVGTAEVSVYSANEQAVQDALTASYQNRVLVYVPRFTSDLDPVPYPDVVLSSTGDVRGTDLALVRRFAQFSVRPTTPYADRVPFDPDGVQIGLVPFLELAPRASLASEKVWVVEADGFAGRSGTLNLLGPLREHLLGVLDPLARNGGDLVASVGAHPRCAGPPATVPVSLASLRHLAIQPAPGSFDSCLDWFAVDLYLRPSGAVAAVTLDLWEP